VFITDKISVYLNKYYKFVFIAQKGILQSGMFFFAFSICPAKTVWFSASKRFGFPLDF